MPGDTCRLSCVPGIDWLVAHCRRKEHNKTPSDRVLLANLGIGPRNSKSSEHCLPQRTSHLLAYAQRSTQRADLLILGAQVVIQLPPQRIRLLHTVRATQKNVRSRKRHCELRILPVSHYLDGGIVCQLPLSDLLWARKYDRTIVACMRHAVPSPLDLRDQMQKVALPRLARGATRTPAIEPAPPS